MAAGLERTGRLITAASVMLAVAIGAFATSKVVFLSFQAAVWRGQLEFACQEWADAELEDAVRDPALAGGDRADPESIAEALGDERPHPRRRPRAG